MLPQTTVVNKAMRLVGARDMARLRALPQHPVHSAAVKAMAAPRHHGDDDSVMMLYSRGLEGLTLRAYLMYQHVHDHLVVIDGVYSPYRGRGHGSALLTALEKRVPTGTTVALVSHPDTTAFFEKRGYEVPVPFRRRLAGLGHLVMAKHILRD